MENRHFEDKGAEYALYRPTYPAEVARTLAALAPGHNLALDVGCGNGQFSVLLADHFDQVLASDISANQLASAVAHEKITYNEGPAETIAARDQSADLVVAAQAAHWFDLPGFYREVKRVTKPGGIIALVTYGVLDVEGPAHERIDRFYWQEIHPYWPEGREAVESGYRTFDFPFEPVETPPLFIERTWSVEHFIKYCHTWSAGKRAVAAGKKFLLDQAHSDLLEIIGKTGHMKIRWPISIRAGRVG